MIGEPAIADAILDRTVHNAHRTELKGDCMRRKDRYASLTSAENTETNDSGFARMAPGYEVIRE